MGLYWRWPKRLSMPVDDLFADYYRTNMKKPPIRRKAQYSAPIKAMQPTDYLYFADANPLSIKVIASRIGKACRPKRVYYTQNEQCGVSVWRET